MLNAPYGLTASPAMALVAGLGIAVAVAATAAQAQVTLRLGSYVNETDIRYEGL